MSSILDLYSISWKGDLKLIALNLFGVIGVIFIIYLPIFVFQIIFVSTRAKEEHFKSIGFGFKSQEEFNSRFRTLFVDLNTNQTYKTQMMSVFYFRRCIFCIIIVVLSSFPLATLIGLILLNLSNLVYFMVSKPFLSVTNRINSV